VNGVLHVYGEKFFSPLVLSFDLVFWVTADTAFILPISMKPAVLLSRSYSTAVNSETNKTSEKKKSDDTRFPSNASHLHSDSHKGCRYGRLVQAHYSLQRLLKSSALYGGERSPSCSDRFIAGEAPFGVHYTGGSVSPTFDPDAVPKWKPSAYAR
jgi:hypothetical protein